MNVKISLLLTWTTLFAASAWAREEYTRTFDKTVTLRTGQRVMVDTKFGDVTIRTHPESGAVIHADVKVSASNIEQAKDFANRVEIFVDDSSDLSVRTHYPEFPKSIFGMRNVSYSVHYTLTLPESAPITVRNAFGGVFVAGAKAGSDINTSHGDLEVRDCRGTQLLENSFAHVLVAGNAGDVTVQTSNGDVSASDITGSLRVHDRFANVSVARVSNGVSISNGNGTVQVDASGGVADIHNSFGSVLVKGLQGDLTVNNANGKVDAADVRGFANLKTSFAEIRFANIGGTVWAKAGNSRITGNNVGGSLTVMNSFAPVEVRDVKKDVRVESGNGSVSLDGVGGTAFVKTSFGSVHADNVSGTLTVNNNNGAVKASGVRGAQVSTSFAPVLLDSVAGPIQVDNQNGSVEASSVLRGSCQPIDIHTSFSGLRLRLEPDASYRVVAKTTFGEAHSDLPITVSGAISSSNLVGTIGSGKCEMRLSNSNGPIAILKAGD